ncbi:hypothetical protein Tco_0976470 [Tanacetum coccineum]|uniref:Uncharacterized protein n=1 Tax=Tanacetum coccineum TaxID=301880 RepID=A0ABQ5EHC8_9ASTR
MEDMMLELLEDCRQKALLCMHNDVEDLIESTLNSKHLLIKLDSQHLNKEEQEVKNIAEPTTKRQTRITPSSPPDSELVSLEEVNVVDQEKEEINLEDILQIQDVILREKLLNINRLITNIESLNDNSTPDRENNLPVSISY